MLQLALYDMVRGASRACTALIALFGCAAAFAQAVMPGDYLFGVTHEQVRRTYLMHVPPQAARGAPMPVVINFHGGGSTAEVQKAYSRMDRAADRDGYIVVYPNGSAGFNDRYFTWNAGNCCGPAAMLRTDDVGFVGKMLDDLPNRARIDPARIYVTGLSNGAMMAYRVAAELSDRIAAVAGVAGAMTYDQFKPWRAMPVMHIHSTNDHIARFDGGLGPPRTVLDTRVYHPPVEDMLRKWLDHDRCPVKPAAIETIGGGPGTPDEAHTAIRRVYRPCRDGVEVVLLQLGGGVGHVWPGGVRDYVPEYLGAGTAVIDANAEMWKFFSRFTRETARAR